jgi:hypothetical protein
VAEREASGDFEYLWDDPDQSAGLTGHDHVSEQLSEPAYHQVDDPETAGEVDYLLRDPGDDPWDEPDHAGWDNQQGIDDDRFDAFNMNAWNFKPAPAPWYRTKQAMAALVATAVAAVAIVVSGVLLVFRSPATSPVDETSTATPTVPTTAAATPSRTSELPPPPPPPPPPPSPPPPPPPPPPPLAPPAANEAPAPRAPVNRPTQRPRPTKEPEIGVTRTPATRSPISVAPQPRTPRN